MTPDSLQLDHPPTTRTSRSELSGIASKRALRLGFLGVGWIGLARMKSIASDPRIEIAAIADPSPRAKEAAKAIAPQASLGDTLDELLAAELDGVIIATPSAQHASQVSAALRSGLAVFCQKPLARTTCETYRVLHEARSRDRLLGVDFCYRYVHGVAELRRLVQAGDLGRLFAIDLVFHNAYGPDKTWAVDLRQSGGGCVIDLATHLIDFALWICDDPLVQHIDSRLYREGQLLERPGALVEDAAFSRWTIGDAHVQMACSWNFSAGCDAEIRMAFHGTEGSGVFHNVGGSFYDFAAELHRGSQRERLASPPDNWGARALTRWVDRLATDPGFDPDIERCFSVASLIDSIYGR